MRVLCVQIVVREDLMLLDSARPDPVAAEAAAAAVGHLLAMLFLVRCLLFTSYLFLVLGCSEPYDMTVSL